MKPGNPDSYEIFSTTLRKQLRQLEKSLLKFAPLQDKEFALLALATKTATNVDQISNNLIKLKNSIYRTEKEVREISSAKWDSGR